jgi:hypothetical protein
VLAVRVERTEVAFVDDPPAMQHEDAVSEVRGQRLGPCHGLARIERFEGDCVEVVALLSRQGADRRVFTRDHTRRHQFPHVRERPARAREADEARVREADHPLRWRRRTDHPLERDWVARPCIEPLTWARVW